MRERKQRSGMKIQLWPDRDIRVRKMKNGTVRALILQPRDRPGDASVGVLWIHGGGYKPA